MPRISIHAPIVGCDSIAFAPIGYQYLFQSTHPSWGATLTIYVKCASGVVFQSTHPSWGATAYVSERYYKQLNFNPRTHRGVRREMKTNRPWTDNFNPRTHRGVRRTYEVKIDKMEIKISIHAPIVGCDAVSNLLKYPVQEFQSTHPSWGATLHLIL